MLKMMGKKIFLILNFVYLAPFCSVFQIKTLTAALEEERTREKPASNKSPQMNGPEMQLYEVQSKTSLFFDYILTYFNP